MCPRKGGKRSLQDFVTISDQQVAMLVQEVLCQAPPAWLDLAEHHFLDNLDFLKPIQVNTGVTWQSCDWCQRGQMNIEY